MSLPIKFNPKTNRISVNIPKKKKSHPQNREKSTGKRPTKNTLEQRVRKLENENNAVWEAIGKVESAMGLKKSKERL